MYIVNVLMSTYNGEKHLREQIESILSQTGVETHITVRDDGSVDGTKKILDEYVKKYPDRISIEYAENVGCNTSFMKLVNTADKTFEYYAFSDQDDVWKSEKLIRAVEALQKDRQTHLYASSLFICDENLNIKSKKNMQQYELSLKSKFVRHSLAGCTMVFDRFLLQQVGRVSEYFLQTKCPSYDFITCVTALLYGSVYIDGEAFIYHRRTATSLTARGWGIRNRIKTEWKVVFDIANQRYDVATVLCRLLNDDKSDIQKQEDIEFLTCVSRYKSSASAKAQLLFYRGFTSRNIWLDLESRIKILINNF